jgi:hypothetical protein
VDDSVVWTTISWFAIKTRVTSDLTTVEPSCRSVEESDGDADADVRALDRGSTDDDV